MPETTSHELHPGQLRWTCDPESLGIQTVKDVPPCEEIIGQDRAIRAIHTGLNIKSHGYNIYVSGLTGTGKTTTVKRLLEQMDTKGETPPDICYVNNFTDQDAPSVLTFAPGQGKAFASDMDRMIRSLRKNIPLVYESDRYKNKRKEILESFKTKTQQSVQAFEEKVKKEGLALVQVQAGLVTRPDILPVIGNNPVPWQALGELIGQGKITEEQAVELRRKHDAFMEELEEVSSLHQELEKETQETLLKLERDEALNTVQAHIRGLKKNYGGERISCYLDVVQNHILHNLDRFKKEEEGDEPKPIAILPAPKAPQADPFLDYKVNVIVDNSKTEGLPIIIETVPTFTNLFGMIERSWSGGVWQSDFTKIKAGSLLRANGGYIVFNLLDAIVEPGIWPVLKRTLKNSQIIIQGGEGMSFFPTTALKPEPIAIDVKVLVIGDERAYRLLYDMDDEFKKIFKIRADFDTVMKNDRRALKQYTSFICKICTDEKLLPLDKDAVAAVVEYGVTLAGRKKKISTRFSDVADVVREAHFWAKEARSSIVHAKHVDKAVEEKEYRLQMIEEKIQEMIEDGTLMLDIRGSRIGQINGLSVYSMGDYAFGKPSKITAETAVGKAGIINIEREAGMGGASYNKGVLIITGYLRRMYAQDKPLSMTASLCFEQSYSGVDGDSASSTEIYALLSSLSETPLRQDIAVTGSVNQKGEIQPIGGVNEKIEGFFDVCRAKRLTGKQGVMIPGTNVDELMLRKDIVRAVENGKFHIWAVETIDQGIEILTGKPAGQKDRAGNYPEASIHFLANQKLASFAERLKEFRSEG